MRATERKRDRLRDSLATTAKPDSSLTHSSTLTRKLINASLVPLRINCLAKSSGHPLLLAFSEYGMASLPPLQTKSDDQANRRDYCELSTVLRGFYPEVVLSELANMPVPFEALIPYGLIIGFMGVTGIGLQTLRYISNDYKMPRRGIDAWDRVPSEQRWEFGDDGGDVDVFN
ncbi:hypothetical protein VTO42DRAFT_2500 [Malbranchea cinnamomea]